MEEDNCELGQQESVLEERNHGADAMNHELNVQDVETSRQILRRGETLGRSREHGELCHRPGGHDETYRFEVEES